MATYTSPFERSPVEEVVPESMKVRGLSKASILTGRRRVRIIPQTGTAYAPTQGQSLANILIQDSAGMLDLQSCVLSFRLRTLSSDGLTAPTSTAVPDDFAWSVLRRLQVSLNSVLCDDIDYVAKRATAEVYASASKSWYNSVGSVMGAWKFLGDSAASGIGPAFALAGAGSAGLALPKNDVTDKLVQATARFKNVVWDAAGAGAWIPASADGQGQYFSIPMAMLSHFFRQESLFSLRNAGQLYIQLLFASPAEALFTGPGVAWSADYRVTDLVLECDIVTAHPEYTAMIDEICSRSESEGMAYAFDSHLVSIQQVAGSGAGGTAQTFTVIASKATQNCRSLHWVLQPQLGLSTQAWMEQSTFNANDTVQWQIRIGSVYYPAFPSQGLSKNFMELMSSYNSPSASVGQASVIDQQSFKTTTSSAGVAYSVTAPIYAGGTAQQADNQVFAYSDQYIGGYCFDNLKHAEVLSHDGVSTLAMSGSQIQLEVRCVPAEQGTAVTYFIRFTRTVLLSENGVQIIG
jgi:hypothetical protein